ncbi:phosphoenolpyruvate synthase [Sulfurimonas sp. HSL3-7]|uniref:phosphoenolpyruvate synthase n=1 Tax=Sulfonitrofixus jiaomeiensis TaxID=3131938 RepID=UPI0031F7A135
MEYIRFFETVGINDVGLVGGKNASLGEMYQHLASLGVNVPNGFSTTKDAYDLLLSQNGLSERIEALIGDLDVTNVAQLQSCGKAVRELILNESLPSELEAELVEAYRELSKTYGKKEIDVAVRSSATAEDLPDASFAGQQESFLNVCGESALILHVKRCYASLFTDRAISYRSSRGFDHRQVALCVGVQKMVRSDQASSGVIFTIDTQSGSNNVITINSVFGLGENIVGGRINPDEFYVFKPTLKADKNAIIKRQLGSKEMKMIYDDKHKTLNISTTESERASFSLSDDEVVTLARYALAIEDHYGVAMDIEWAKDSIDGNLYIVQARPETVHSKRQRSKDADHIEKYTVKEDTSKRTRLLSGQAIGEKIGTGVVKVIRDLSEASRFQAGEVLVADITDPDWEPLMKKAAAIVTNKGGRTCHAAIVAREIGVSAIVGTANATELLHDGMEVSVCCAEGEVGYVYEGEIAFEVESIDLSDMQEPKTKLFMNVGNPEQAFSLALIPNQGVGLARMEFIINNHIKAHPMALYDMYQGRFVKGNESIVKLMEGFSDPRTFFVNKLSEGVGMIAAAFYPNPVIVRTSDFKSNEYKHMLGGEAYEKDEENPMIGFRGASRYYSDAYKEAFKWECEALKKVRDDMGLTNVKLMLPFVRTPDEGRKVIAIMNEMGLTQGENGLEIYAMCEIPSNVIFADEFLKVFDGYSIGSNDLTQLTLGVDRDSTSVAHIFDERNEAVKRMLKMAIDACKKEGKYVGICGQAPSDYPEITEFLVQNGISSISLNPDSVMKMRQVVVELEKRL